MRIHSFVQPHEARSRAEKSVQIMGDLRLASAVFMSCTDIKKETNHNLTPEDSYFLPIIFLWLFVRLLSVAISWDNFWRTRDGISNSRFALGVYAVSLYACCHPE